MLAYRVIARLDIKGENLIKPLQYEGLRVLGKSADFAKKYAEEGADELLYLDTVASLYGRNQLESLIEQTSGSAFIPLTVSGGIQSLLDVCRVFNSGADRVAINSASHSKPELIGEISDYYGPQALVCSIEAKRVNGGWEPYIRGGREKTGKEVVGWAKEAEKRGAGEIFLTSIDKDGLRKGPDWPLLEAIQDAGLTIPLVYSGGIRLQDVVEVSRYTEGMAIGASLHYGDCTIKQIKEELSRSGKEIRLT